MVPEACADARNSSSRPEALKMAPGAAETAYRDTDIFGMTDAADLAMNNPESAINNADNFAHYAVDQGQPQSSGKSDVADQADPLNGGRRDVTGYRVPRCTAHPAAYDHDVRRQLPYASTSKATPAPGVHTPMEQVYMPFVAAAVLDALELVLIAAGYFLMRSSP